MEEECFSNTPKKFLFQTPSTTDSFQLLIEKSNSDYKKIKQVSVSKFQDFELREQEVDKITQQVREFNLNRVIDEDELSSYSDDKDSDDNEAEQIEKINNEENQYYTQYQSDVSLNDLNQIHLGYDINKYKQKKSDRYIPNRRVSKLNIALTPVHETDENQISLQDLKGRQYKNENQVSVVDMYKSHVLGLKNTHYNQNQYQQNEIPFSNKSNNIFKYNDSPPKQRSPLQTVAQPMLFSNNKVVDTFYKQESSPVQERKINKVPFKVLDAPSLQDDFYLNLVDWSKSNMLAVALASCVYLWQASTNKVVKFCDLGVSDMVTSVNWNPLGNSLSVGTSLGDIQIYDANKLKKICTLSGHTARVSSLAWSNHLLSSGSRDKNILQRDLRTDTNYVRKLTGHKQEVCGLKWSFDEQQLASGGNDNKLLVWNAHSSNPICKFTQHQAAVKALAWSPHQHGLLASGGGTADRTIRFWNTLNNSQVDWIDTGSQICNLLFSKNVNELVSTHGYSLNQIIIWKYPSMEKIVDLTGHTSRVLYLSMSPDGETIVTGAGDETLRFWNIFPKKNQDYSQLQSSNLISGMRDLR